MGPPPMQGYQGSPSDGYSSYSAMTQPAGAYPNYYQPYPEISPYEQEFNQIANRNGLWESESQSRIGLPSRWKFRTEYVRMKSSQGKKLIGNSIAPIYREQIRTVLEGAGGGGGGGADIEDYLAALTGDGNGGSGFSLFDPVRGDEITSPNLKGLRLTLEGENADGSGIELWGLWAQDKSNEFNARDSVAPSRGAEQELIGRIYDDFNQMVISGDTPLSTAANSPNVFEILQNNLLNLRGIPLDDGTLERVFGDTYEGGASAVYDLDFRIKNDIEVYGTGLKWKSMPLYKTDSVRIRPNTGFRYMAIKEGFGFFGRDSGILYDNQANANNPPLPDVKLHSLPNNFDDNADMIVDNAGAIEDSLGGQGGGGGGGAATMASFYILGDPQLYPITSFLNNTVNSHLVGPEFGLNYDLGGAKGFRMGGSSNVGVLLNYHEVRMSGDNIFVTTRQSNLIPASPTNARPNGFGSSTTHRSISPMFEQMFYAEGPLFQYLPILRRSSILRNAQFRAACTVTVIGELTRAGDSILWQGNPSENLFPEIRTSKSTWTGSSWDFGVVWSW
jgi:hypothetical protein